MRLIAKAVRMKFIVVELQLCKIFKIMRVSLFGTHFRHT